MNCARSIMFLSLLVSFVSGFCQQSVPVFTDRKDSIDYAITTDSIQLILKRNQNRMSYGVPSKDLDSLFNLHRTLREKAIGFRDIYKSRMGFTTYADLKSGNINPKKVRRLSFDEKVLFAIPEEVYGCINLEEIEFVNSKITQLPSKLRTLKKLRSIYVYNNEPSKRLKLKRNQTIEKLIIRGSYGVFLPVNFKKLRNLDTLDLKRNLGMTAFPEISRNKKLSKLVLSENELTLSDLKKGSRSLRDLNLSKNKIISVPKAIGQFPQLKNLELSYNQIANVSDDIGKLKSLESVSFYENKLTAIPSGIFELSGLRSIDLYFNRLDEVDPAIGNLTQLRILYLSNNFLKQLPESIGNLSNLLALYAHHNDLDSLPSSLGKLKQLRRIGLNDNNLIEVPLYFLDFRELEDLDLSGNKIFMFPIGWTNLLKLQTLGIYGNPFQNRKEVDKEVDQLTKMGTICRYKIVDTK